jgi:hypothetical protein
MCENEVKYAVVVFLVWVHTEIFSSDKRVTATPVLVTFSDENATTAPQHFVTYSGDSLQRQH